ncbi:hypothetical protein M4D52_09545 [Paenibacillus lactis]|uniref:hypothetical protein n=1 Tax=Paenibacillus lactis TaxID=228574 RepID=UPI00203C6D1A|nr:hypothetical protein [Paenibacillus lactis]MCM3493671.1 hypothetical protein [Paenibacillus lactis]
MKKRYLLKWIIITTVLVLISNLLQFVVSNRVGGDKLPVTSQPIHDNNNSYNIFTDYSSRIQSTYRLLLELENDKYSKPNDAFLLSQGFLIGNSTDYYSNLEVLIQGLDSTDYNHELHNIVETNKNLQTMIYKLNRYFFTQRNNAKLPENWEEIKELLAKISTQLTSESTKDVSLYNITSYPKEFVTKSKYTTAISTLNKDIFKVIDLIDN